MWLPPRRPRTEARSATRTIPALTSSRPMTEGIHRQPTNFADEKQWRRISTEEKLTAVTPIIHLFSGARTLEYALSCAVIIITIWITYTSVVADNQANTTCCGSPMSRQSVRISTGNLSVERIFGAAGNNYTIANYDSWHYFSPFVISQLKALSGLCQREESEQFLGQKLQLPKELHSR